MQIYSHLFLKVDFCGVSIIAFCQVQVYLFLPQISHNLNKRLKLKN